MQAFPTAVMHTVRDGADPIRLAVHEQGKGPAVVFSHGFPELAYSWRHPPWQHATCKESM